MGLTLSLPRTLPILIERLAELEHKSLLAVASLKLSLTARTEANSSLAPTLIWLDGLFDLRVVTRRSDTQKTRRLRDELPVVAISVLSSFLSGTKTAFQQLFWEVVRRCFSSKESVRAGYIQGLAEFLCSGPPRQSVKELIDTTPELLSGLLHVGLFHSGSANERVRQAAIRILRTVHEKVVAPGSDMPMYGINSGSLETRQRSQIELSALFAKQAPQESAEMLDQALQQLRGSTVRQSSTQLWLQLLKPWIATVDLGIDQEIRVSVVHGLLVLTKQYMNIFPQSLHDLWTSLAAEYNVGHIISTILALHPRKGADLLVLSKFLCVDLVLRSASATIDCLVGELLQLTYNRETAPTVGGSGGVPRSHSNSPSLTPTAVDALDALLPDLSEGVLPPLTRPDFVLVLLDEVSYFCTTFFKLRLAQLVHVMFLSFDFPTSTVYEHCKVLLENLLTGIVLRHYESLGLTPDKSDEMRQTVDLIDKLHELDQHREQQPAHQRKCPPTGTALTPRRVASQQQQQQQQQQEEGDEGRDDREDGIFALVPEVTAAFENVVKEIDFRSQWLDECHGWVTGCVQIPQAIRSCKIYRQIMETHNEEQILLILERVAASVNGTASEPNSAALVEECLRTTLASLQLLPVEALATKVHFFHIATALLLGNSAAIFSAALPIVRLFVDAAETVPAVAATICAASIPPEGQESATDTTTATPTTASPLMAWPRARRVHDLVQALVHGTALGVCAGECVRCLAGLLAWPWVAREPQWSHHVVLPVVAVLVHALQCGTGDADAQQSCAALEQNTHLHTRFVLVRDAAAAVQCAAVLRALREAQQAALVCCALAYALRVATRAPDSAFVGAVVRLALETTRAPCLHTRVPRLGAATAAVLQRTTHGLAQMLALHPALQSRDACTLFEWLAELPRAKVTGEDEDDEEEEDDNEDEEGMGVWVHAVCRDGFAAQFSAQTMRRAATTLEEVLQTCQALTSPSANEIRTSDTHTHPHLSQQHFFLDTASETAHSIRQSLSGVSLSSSSSSSSPSSPASTPALSEDNDVLSVVEGSEDWDVFDEPAHRTDGAEAAEPAVPIPGIETAPPGADAAGSVPPLVPGVGATEDAVLAFPTFRGLEGLLLEVKESADDDADDDDAKARVSPEPQQQQQPRHTHTSSSGSTESSSSSSSGYEDAQSVSDEQSDTDTPSDDSTDGTE